MCVCWFVVLFCLSVCLLFWGVQVVNYFLFIGNLLNSLSHTHTHTHTLYTRPHSGTHPDERSDRLTKRETGGEGGWEREKERAGVCGGGGGEIERDAYIR